MPIHDELGHRKRVREFLRARRDSKGEARPDLWRQAVVDFLQLDVDASVLWSSIGPGPLNVDAQVPADKAYQGIGPDAGEVTDIAISSGGQADSTIYIATNDGGIWKTVDGGANWHSTCDGMPSLSMGAVAIHPSNPQIVYAGTGNFYDGGNNFTKGVGIYRSSDGGDTWSILDGGPFGTIYAGCSITRIQVLSTDHLLVASNEGLYRSVDGGQHFGGNTPDFNDQKPVLKGFITCLLLDAASPETTVYAAVRSEGVFKSSDGGATFLTKLFPNPGAEIAQPFSNLEIAQSESNPQTLLVSVQYTVPAPDNSKIFRGLFESTDGGAHWSLLTTIPPAASDGFGQTDYDLTLGIDPQNPSLVYAGFQELWKSLDGGRTFQETACTAPQVHWDHHVLTFSPKSHRTPHQPVPLYVGTDGGIAKSTDGGATWDAINGAIASNLFFGIDIGRGPNNNAYTYGGCQDTGTSAHRPADAGTTVWHLGIDGDGYQVAVDPIDPTIVYGFDDSAFIKSADAGVTWQLSGNGQVGNNLPDLRDPMRTVALEQRGQNPVARIVYVGLDDALYISWDAGVIFSKNNWKGAGRITAIATTPSDSGRIWIGTDTGNIYVSQNGGDNWDEKTPPHAADGTVASIAIDSKNASRVAVAYGGLSGINSKYRTQRIFLTNDSGGAWNDMSGTDGAGPVGNLPDLPLHAVVFDSSADPSAIIVSNDAGVMRCTNATTGGDTKPIWKIYGAGLPNVSCSSLAIDNSVSPPILRVGTYGRGCFEVTRPAGLYVYVESNLGFGPVVLGQQIKLPLYVYSCGDQPLNVQGLKPLAGSADFSVNPPTEASIAPGATQVFEVVFAPRSLGDQSATFGIVIDGFADPSLVVFSGRGVSAGKPRLATDPGVSAGFGSVALTANRTIAVQIFNTGTADLHVSDINFYRASDFSLDPKPGLPITVAAGGKADVTLKYSPTRSGFAKAYLRIQSDGGPDLRAIYVHGNGI